VETPDPLGGSYWVEELTDRVEKEAREYLERIDEMGGASKAIEYMQEEIHRAAYRFQMEVESGERPVVGVNVQREDEGPVRIGQPDYSALEQAQVERLGTFREERDDAQVRARLGAVSDAARGSDNLLPIFVDAVKAGVTLGEISDALRAAWGTYDG
jgi:methylmalonyl-CoA mutase N-terminal domain/subunit